MPPFSPYFSTIFPAKPVEKAVENVDNFEDNFVFTGFCGFLYVDNFEDGMW